MGLSGRKVKQRIGADPRNLSWADDAARFGSNYLSKFGWDASKGLGAGGDGMKSHIKVSHKLDMLGIGAAQTKDPNGIAWKQNRDFENLLRRLNENLPAVERVSTEAEDKAREDAAEGQSDAEAGEEKKKRKHRETEDEDQSERKKKKKEAKEKSVVEDGALVAQIDSVKLDSVETTATVAVVQKAVALPRHRAHRARAIAAKNIASKSSAHISEILGVAPDAQAVVVESALKCKLTSVTETDALGMDKITTSTKSLADYFKDKLQARMGSSSGSATPTSTASVNVDDEEERPRMGIGASRMLLEIQTETRIEEETQRVGLSKFSSLMSSSFLAATSMSAFIPPQAKKDEAVAHISESEPESESDSAAKKRSKKEKKDKKKEKKAKDVSDEEVREIKSKKDKKGKGKAIEVEEALSDSDEEKRRKKKEKKKKSAEAEDVNMDSTEDVLDKAARKEAKKKHKAAKKLEAKAQASQEPIVLKKEKKRRADS